MTDADGPEVSEVLGKNVLIVEDERIVARDLEMSLTDLGFLVTGLAESCEEALRMISERAPDIVLMDVHIRGERDGIDTAEILRRQIDVPIVFLTAHADRPTLERAKKTGPLAFLPKPFRSSELFGVLEIALYRHRIERQLRERAHWLSVTFSSIADAVVSVDASGSITLMNKEAEHLLSLKSERVLGRPISEHVMLVDEQGRALPSESLESVLGQILGQRKTVSFDEVCLSTSADRNLRCVRWNGAPVIDGDHTLGAVIAFSDICEAKKLQAAEQETYAQRLRSEEAEAAVTHRENFMAIAAHELRTPLAALSLKLQALARTFGTTPVSARVEADVGAAIRQAARLGQLIEHLLDASRIARRDFELTRQEVDLGMLVRNIAEELKEHARKVSSEIRTTARGNATGLWDKGRMEQVVMNLIQNALKFGAGSPVEVSVVAGEREVSVIVRDHGTGVPPALLDRIFDRFQRADSTQNTGGMGLGLYVARHIVEAHGGSIRAANASGPGSGAIFVIDVPRTPSPENLLVEITSGLEQDVLSRRGQDVRKQD